MQHIDILNHRLYHIEVYCQKSTPYKLQPFRGEKYSYRVTWSINLKKHWSCALVSREREGSKP